MNSQTLYMAPNSPVRPQIISLSQIGRGAMKVIKSEMIGEKVEAGEPNLEEVYKLFKLRNTTELQAMDQIKLTAKQLEDIPAV